MTDTPMIPADVAAARVAAAYEVAANVADYYDGDGVDVELYGQRGDALHTCQDITVAIRALAAADPDGQAALARLLAEARAEGMREAGALVPGAVHKWLRTKASLGVKMQMGYVVNDMIADVRAAILAAADKVAAK